MWTISTKSSFIISIAFPSIPRTSGIAEGDVTLDEYSFLPTAAQK